MCACGYKYDTNREALKTQGLRNGYGLSGRLQPRHGDVAARHSQTTQHTQWRAGHVRRVRSQPPEHGLMTTRTWQVFRLLDDGHRQSLGFYVNEQEAYRAFEYQSERLHFAYVDIEEVTTK